MQKLTHRVQDDNQPADSFIINLNALPEHCGYENLHDEMVRLHHGGPARCHTH